MSWDEMKKAKEGSYFEKKNNEALERLAKRTQSENKSVLMSPVTGEPMEELVINGVVVDKCKTSGGIWLDAGELETLLNHVKEEADKEGALSHFIHKFLGK